MTCLLWQQGLTGVLIRGLWPVKTSRAVATSGDTVTGASDLGIWCRCVSDVCVHLCLDCCASS
jgi:hypothetical protein